MNINGNGNGHIKAAIYSRVSTQEQATEGTSMDVQKDQLEKYCQLQNWTIINAYTDPGFTGKDGERPGLQRLLADAKMGIFNRIIVLKLDRLARNLRLLLQIEEQLKEHKVSLSSVKENIDTSTPIGRTVFQVLGLVAEWERDTFIERSKSGRIQRYKEGCWGPGHPPYGFDYNRETKKLAINSNEALIIKRIFDEYSKGKSTWGIANLLNSEKIPPRRSGKGWRNTSVRNVLYNPVYKGTQVVNIHQARKGIPKELPQTAIKIKVPAIVEESLWDIAHDRMKNNKHLHPPMNGHWLLYGLVTCGLCGYGFKAERTHGRRSYGCRGHLKYTHIDGSPRCTTPHIDAEWLEHQVWQKIEDIINDPNKLEVLIKQTVNSLSLRENDLSARIKPIDKRLNDITEQRAKLAEDWVTGSLNPLRLQELKRNLDLEENRLRSIRSEIDPSQIEELKKTSGMLKFWESQLSQLSWDTETENSQKTRVVDNPHKTVLNIIGFNDKDISNILHFPATKREILDMLQVKVIVFMDRIEIKALFTIEPIGYQELQSNSM